MDSGKSSPLRAAPRIRHVAHHQDDESPAPHGGRRHVAHHDDVAASGRKQPMSSQKQEAATLVTFDPPMTMSSGKKPLTSSLKQVSSVKPSDAPSPAAGGRRHVAHHDDDDGNSNTNVKPAPTPASAGRRHVAHHDDDDDDHSVGESIPLATPVLAGRRHVAHHDDDDGNSNTDATPVPTPASAGRRHVSHHDDDDDDRSVGEVTPAPSKPSGGRHVAHHDEDVISSSKNPLMASRRSPSPAAASSSIQKSSQKKSSQNRGASPLSTPSTNPMSTAEQEAWEVQRVSKLRATYEYFKEIQSEMDLDMQDYEGGAKPVNQQRQSTQVWSNLKRVVNVGAFTNPTSSTKSASKKLGFATDVAMLMQAQKMKQRQQLDNDGNGDDESKEAPEPQVSMEEEDEALSKYWASLELQLPDDPEITSFVPPDPPTFEQEYAAESKVAKVVLGQIPKEVVRQQKEVLKTKLYEERAKTIDGLKNKERDVMWREHLAMERVKKMEEDNEAKMVNERIKMARTRMDREKRLAREFRRARDSLESSVQRQGAVMGEVFGELDTMSKRSMARKMYVKSVQTPQPVEFRVHCLRAARNRLPKGAYNIMVTQYDALGGNALAWSVLGSHSIGSDFPGATRAVKHMGRYFDKAVKFEDSCFALCPPQKDCKPTFVFVFELFELKSRTNSHDKVVAWTAMPMVTDAGSISQGKMKLPLLRGRHNPHTTLFKDMEERIAEDLDQWLCNLYVEVRAFSLSELGPMAKDAIKLGRFINFDYFNKRLDVQNGKGQYSHLFGNAAAAVRHENGQDENEDEEIRIDSGLLRLNQGRQEQVMLDRSERKSEKFASKGRVFDLQADEKSRKESLDVGDPLHGNFDAFREKNDGFGAFSRKVKESEARSNGVGQRIRMWGERVYTEYVLGEEYIPEYASPGKRSIRIASKQARTVRDPEYSARVRQQLMETNKKFDHTGTSSTPSKSARIVDVRGVSDMPATSKLRMKPSQDGQFNVDGRAQLFESSKSNAEEYNSSDDEGAELDEEAGAAGGSSKKSRSSKSSKSGKSNNEGSSSDIEQQPSPALVVPGMEDFGDLDSDGFSTDESDDEKEKEEEAVEIAPLGPTVKELREIEGKKEQKRKLAQKKRDAEDELVSVELLDRGLELQVPGSQGGISIASDLNIEQSGKLLGVEAVDSQQARFFAASGLNRKVTRRLQADGPRLDSEGIPDSPTDMDKEGDGGDDSKQTKDELAWLHRLQPSMSMDGPSVKWSTLEDHRDFELYNMSLQAQSAAQKLTAGGIVTSKMRLLTHEVLGDLTHHKWGTFDFWVTLFTVLFTLWLRVWLHYLGQYMYLGSLGVPIYDFEYAVMQLSFKYMSAALDFGPEVCVVFMGPLFVTICFCIFSELIRGFYTYAKYDIPEGVSKFVSCYGLNMILGPVITLFLDICYSNYNCTNQSDECRADYTSTDCDCFTGDFAKLWERARADEGSGISGMFITVIIYVVMTAMSLYFYYEYLVHNHKGGRILDIWRRISASDTEFFIPNDYEISLEELKVICAKANRWIGADGSKRKLSVSVHEERDPDDPSFLQETKLFTVHEISFDGQKRKVWRQFIAEPHGAILEVFDKLKFGEDQKDLALPSPDFGFSHPTAVNRTRTGVFKGLERA